MHYGYTTTVQSRAYRFERTFFLVATATVP